MRLTRFHYGFWHLRVYNTGLYWYIWPAWLHRLLDRLVIRWWRWRGYIA